MLDPACQEKPPTPVWQRLLGVLLYGVLYHLSVELNRSVLTVESYTIMRPTTGLALGVLMAVPLRIWPLYMIVGIVADVLSIARHEGLADLSYILPVVNTSEAALGALLIRTIRYPREHLVVLKDLGLFLTVVALLSTGFVTSVMLAVQFWVGRPVIDDDLTWAHWQSWWLADLLGILVVTPPVFSILSDRRFRVPEVSGVRSGEFGFLMAAILGLTLIVFSGGFSGDNLLLVGVPSVLVPFLFWLVLRFDFRVVTSVWLLVALFSGWSTQQDLGPFARTTRSVYDRVLANQEFLGVLTLSVLTLCVVLNERRLREVALERSELKYRNVVEDQTELIVRALPDLTLTFVNDATCRFFGKGRDELIGHRLGVLDGDGDGDGDGSAFVDRLTAAHAIADREVRVVRPGREEAWLRWNVRALFDSMGQLVAYQSVGRDVTEVKRAEDELRRANDRLAALSSRILQVQEEERHAIARELHDEVGQNLTAMTVNLRRLRNHAPDDDTRARIDDTTALAEQTLREVRDLALDLRPSILDDFGLVPALQWYLERQASRAGFEADVEVESPAPSLTAAVETMCFRLVQEAVTNVIRHANAGSVRVSLGKDGDEVKLVIRDDGSGFDVNQALQRTAKSGSLGLLGMKERAGLVGGRLRIESATGQGTTITATFPPRPVNGPATTPP